ncbi:hypothetical protein C8J56DRAFT_760466, partial [Mycena floridula]
SELGGVVVGGIQEIAALLPLLGTEQCEDHTGSALTKGLLYSSITPASLFGSVGIAKMGFAVLIACIPVKRFMFAKALSDAGFRPKGKAAPLIALDPAHEERYLAESLLDAMLLEEHIE